MSENIYQLKVWKFIESHMKGAGIFCLVVIVDHQLIMDELLTPFPFSTPDIW